MIKVNLLKDVTDNKYKDYKTSEPRILFGAVTLDLFLVALIFTLGFLAGVLSGLPCKY